MVHALEEIHRLLAPDGRLLDIHPFAEPPLVEIHQAGRITFSEPAPDYPVADVQNAEKALAHVVRKGLFAVEREGAFHFRTYASSVAELTDFLAGQGGWTEEKATERERAMATHVEQRLAAAGEGAEVALHERVQMTLLRAERPVSAATSIDQRSS